MDRSCPARSSEGDGTDGVEGREFAEVVAANKALLAMAEVAPVAEDVTFPEATGLDYTTALTQVMRGFDAIARRVSDEEARTFAEAICCEIPGSAPVVALHQLDSGALNKVATAGNPCGYLRSVLRRKVDELDGQEYELPSDEALTDWLSKIKVGFLTRLNDHPRRIDDMVSRVRIDRVIGTPYIQGGEMVFPVTPPESHMAANHVGLAPNDLAEELE